MWKEPGDKVNYPLHATAGKRVPAVVLRVENQGGVPYMKIRYTKPPKVLGLNGQSEGTVRKGSDRLPKKWRQRSLA